MKSGRLFVALLGSVSLVVACSSNEEPLLKAKAALEPQLEARRALLRDLPELKRHDQHLNAARSELRKNSKNVLVRPPEVPLSRPSLPPLFPPEIPRKGTLESARVRTLRAEIAAQLEEARRLDREITELEAFRDRVKLLHDDVVSTDALVSAIPPQQRIFDTPEWIGDAGMAVSVDAGWMRRNAP